MTTSPLTYPAKACLTEFLQIDGLLPNNSKTINYNTDSTKKILGVGGNLTNMNTNEFFFMDNVTVSITYTLTGTANNTNNWLITIKNLTNNSYNIKLIVFVG